MHEPGFSFAAELADVNARRAIDAPADAPLLAITGRAASGKTETLARRYVALLARDTTLTPAATIVTAAGPQGAAALAARIDALLPSGARAGRDYFGTTLDRLAFAMLADHAALSGLAYDLEAINVYDAEALFERAIAPLFSADWNDFLGPDIDPEIPGLRAPERFAGAVFRLIVKLRAAQIGPDAFLNAALRGATAFYANPPNLAAPALLFATKDEHRNALAVDESELDRQRRRELDLAKIITKVYRAYLDGLVANGCLTAADAVAQATRLLDEHPALARSYRQRFRIALVDDVHDLPTGEFRLLTMMFGPTLAGVTVAGDPDAATQTFAGARPERIFGSAAVTLALQANYRVPPPIAAAVGALLGPSTATPNRTPIPAGDALRLHRAATLDAEAAFVAGAIAARIAAGTPAARIAVLHRSLRALGPFEDALVDADIPIALRGDAALFLRHDTLDALGLLWSTVDPFAHGWLLRVLQLPFLALSDAALATLCGEPANPQAALFDVPPAPDGEGARRWDRRRDLRLGTNVVRGDRDLDLEPEARRRLGAFRARRARWQELVRTTDVMTAARAILADGGVALPRPAETAARTRRRAGLTSALLDVMAGYAARHRGAGLAEALGYCERIGRAESGPLCADGSADAVVVAQIDRVKGQRFDHVFIVDVRAGSFPPYYVPDAFLFSPTYGMIPKDSVGEASTARTAKFTWYMHHAKLRESYAREDRRALAVGLTRADASVTVSASGRPTRGIAAPELLVELQGLLGDARVDTSARAAAGPSASRIETCVAPPIHLPGPGPSANAPHSTRRAISAERLASMVSCVRCAPHVAPAAAMRASFTLLSGRLAARDRRLVERDISFAFGLDAASVYGTLPALIRHAGRLYAVLAHPGVVGAALAIAGLRERVEADGFFVETTPGVFTGPQPIVIDESLAAAGEVLAGTRVPLCAEHQGP